MKFKKLAQSIATARRATFSMPVVYPGGIAGKMVPGGGGGGSLG